MKWLALGLILSISGCGGPMQYSPWQSNPPNNDLTAKHLNELSKADTGVYEEFKIAILGDPQAVIGHLDRAASVINSRGDIDFTVIVGDITDRGMQQEFIWINDVLSKFNKPILTVVGNHDGLNNGKKLYAEMFGPFNYSFIYKDVKFVMWNNNAYEWSVDVEWLAREVESHHRVVVLSHQPPGDGALSSAQEQRWKEIRQHPNLIASIHGHVHHYNFRQEDALPIYTVDRVTGSHYGTVTFGEELRFHNCAPVCEEVK